MTTRGRKESEDTSKVGADIKKPDDGMNAAGAVGAPKHAQDTTKNGTSVSDIKTKLDNEVKGGATSATGTGAAS